MTHGHKYTHRLILCLQSNLHIAEIFADVFIAPQAKRSAFCHCRTKYHRPVLTDIHIEEFLWIRSILNLRQIYACTLVMRSHEPSLLVHLKNNIKVNQESRVKSSRLRHTVNSFTSTLGGAWHPNGCR